MFTDLRKWDDAKKLAQQYEGSSPPIMAEMSGGSIASTFFWIKFHDFQHDFDVFEGSFDVFCVFS